MSPFRLSFPPQPSVFSQPPLAIQPNFYASDASSFLSMTCRLLLALCSLFRTRFLCFHQLAASFSKMPGVAYPDPVFGLSVGVDEDSRCRRCFYGIPGYLGGTSAPSASLHPACPELRGEPRRVRYPLLLLLSPRGTTLRGVRTDPFSRRSRCPLSTFRINTYEKPRGRGGYQFPAIFLATRSPRSSRGHSPLVTSSVTCATWRLYPLSPQSIAHTSRRHGGGTPFPRFQPALASV